jgi:hypothetical protein
VIKVSLIKVCSSINLVQFAIAAVLAGIVFGSVFYQPQANATGPAVATAVEFVLFRISTRTAGRALARRAIDRKKFRAVVKRPNSKVVRKTKKDWKKEEDQLTVNNDDTIRSIAKAFRWAFGDVKPYGNDVALNRDEILRTTREHVDILLRGLRAAKRLEDVPLDQRVVAFSDYEGEIAIAWGDSNLALETTREDQIAILLEAKQKLGRDYDLHTVGLAVYCQRDDRTDLLVSLMHSWAYKNPCRYPVAMTNGLYIYPKEN